ncbi:hypothetical protein [Taibaiella koreensis]|uniref:hypothetical protein n=1 Tax=Taibaiella koreensis TaxID=1268548 RepID=UPI000E59B5F6|nr:hypothetical protein [Taibaiella koreensis]
MFVSRTYQLLLLPVLLLLGSMAALPAYGQKGNGVVLRLADSVPEVRNEELKDVTIAIDNRSTQPFKGILHLYCGKGARIATRQDVPIIVEAGKSLFVAAKVYIGATTLAGDIPYSAQLFDERRTKLGEATARLRLTGSRLMRASLAQTELQLPTAGQILQVPVLLSNRGNSAQEVNVVLAYPPELHDETNKSIKVIVPPFHDTTLYFSRKVSRSMVSLEYMDISLYGVYPGGDYFSISSASVQSVKSRKVYGSKRLNGYSDRGANYVTVGTQNTFTENESYFLQSRGDYALSKGNVAFSLNLYKWKNPAMPFLLNDTWLGFEYQRLGIAVGNIIQNGEMSYNGRGVEAYYFTDSLRRNKLYAGYLDKSFNLVSNNGASSFGRAAWAGYQREYGRMRNNTMITYDEDKYTSAKSMLLVNDASWRLNDLLFAAAKIGIANSATSGENSESRQSLSIGASMNGNLTKNLSVSSDNLYASGYYPGTRRGTLSFNERLSLRLGSITLGGGFMYNELNPLYFQNSGIGYRNSNNGTTGEFNIARAFGNLNLSLAAQYYQEQGNWYLGPNPIEGEMKAGRLSLGGSYAGIRSRQYLMFRFDAGQYQLNFMPGQRWQFRGNLSYNYRFFRFTGNIQKGSFYLAEAFQEQNGGHNDLRLNLAPALSYTFFDRKLRVDAGLTYYKDFYVSSVLYSAGIDFGLSTTRLFALLQYNTFASSSSYRNVQFGLTQLLPQSGRETVNRKGSIELFVFHDNNANGLYDAGDSIATGYLAAFDKTLLATSGAGRIQYNKLPPGTYKVYFPTQKGWYGVDQLIALKDKEAAHLDIPLRQTGTLSGNITFEFDEVLSYAILRELAGQTVIATNNEGKTFETRTDDAGHYMLYVPTGTYTLTIGNLPAQIEVLPLGIAAGALEVNPGQITGDVDFRLKVRQRKIEVKKFGQQ